MKNFKILVFVFFMSFQAGAGNIVIGSKIFTENILLGEMLALLLEEKYNYKVTRKFNIGGTKLVFDALKSGQIDIYPEYTGTGYIMLLHLSEKRSSDEIYRIVKKQFLKKFKMVWSLPLGFNNSYALAVRSDDERFKKNYKISDLEGQIKSSSLAVGHEFMERKDGYESFIKSYDISFPKNKVYSMNSSLMYSALKNKEVDMIMSYSTDGRIKSYRLKLLEDDKKHFISYQAAYLTRSNLLNKFPKVRQAFRDLENNIDEKEMIALNDQVDRLKYEKTNVAKNFLIQKNLLDEERTDLYSKNLLSYYYSKRDYLLKIFIEHLILTFSSLFIALFCSLPVGVFAARKEKVAKVVFPIVNTLQTIPSLALLGFLIPFLGIGYAPAIFTLFIYSLLPLIRNTYEGLKGVDKNSIEVAVGIGLTKRQILNKIEVPLSLPIIIAGIRTSAVIVVGTATLAALVGAGGLGEPIFRGMAMVDSRLIFLGAVPAALLAIFLDRFLSFIELLFVSKGLRLKENRS